MNKVTPKPSEFEAQSVDADALSPVLDAATQTKAADMPKQPPRANPAGPQKPGKPIAPKAEMATKQDMIELHNRIVRMFTTLNQGLSESAQVKAREDRAALGERLDHMQQAINDMEGMLRIEMAPQLRVIVKEELEDQWVSERSRSGGRFFKLLMLIGAVAVGTVFADQILIGAGYAADRFFELKDKIVPLWGHLVG